MRKRKSFFSKDPMEIARTLWEGAGALNKHMNQQNDSPPALIAFCKRILAGFNFFIQFYGQRVVIIFGFAKKKHRVSLAKRTDYALLSKTPFDLWKKKNCWWVVLSASVQSILITLFLIGQVAYQVFLR